VHPVFDHVTIRVADRAASDRFYETVLTTLGMETSYHGGAYAEWEDFSIAQSDAGHPVTQGLHVGFVAPSREQVDAFWAAGIEAGYADAGKPGPRPQYTEDYYGAFLRDPDGNSVEAVHHAALRRGGIVDHLWVRVADLAASEAFYRVLAPLAGLSVRAREPHLLRLGAHGGSLTLIAEPGTPPTTHLHIAFPSDDDAAIVRFYEALVAAGHPSQGAPGERPQYHPGYYAAYVLDPDGTNVELVNHHRG
jgi:catechol 2,3-dioxygenase-like lactoylglutathione lyase family enzyme